MGPNPIIDDFIKYLNDNHEVEDLEDKNVFSLEVPDKGEVVHLSRNIFQKGLTFTQIKEKLATLDCQNMKIGMFRPAYMLENGNVT